MAKTLGEQPSETVRYAMHFDPKISENTRIEAVIEGMITLVLDTILPKERDK